MMKYLQKNLNILTFVLLMLTFHCACNRNIQKHVEYWGGNEKKMKTEGKWIFLETKEGSQKVQHGVWRNWYENGQLHSKIHFDEGCKTKIAKYWYRNGQLKQIVPYNSKGLPDGIAKWWNNDGEILKESKIRNGTGVDFYFYDNGKERSKIIYFKGRAKKEIMYDKSGTATNKTSFQRKTSNSPIK